MSTAIYALCLESRLATMRASYFERTCLRAANTAENSRKAIIAMEKTCFLVTAITSFPLGLKHGFAAPSLNELSFLFFSFFLDELLRNSSDWPIARARTVPMPALKLAGQC